MLKAVIGFLLLLIAIGGTLVMLALSAPFLVIGALAVVGIALLSSSQD